MVIRPRQQKCLCRCRSQAQIKRGGFTSEASDLLMVKTTNAPRFSDVASELGNVEGKRIQDIIPNVRR